MEPDPERLRDLLMERRGSRWPQVLGLLLVLAAAGGAGYWCYLHPDRLTLENLKTRVKSVLNTPVLTSPAPPPAAPAENDLLTPNMKPSSADQAPK